MSSWLERAPEERRIYNPAMVAALIQSAARGAAEEESVYPLQLIHLLAPVGFDPVLRAALPRTISTSLPAWIGEHPFEQRLVAVRARLFADVTREGCLFGLRYGMLFLEGGTLRAPTPLPRHRRVLESSVSDIHRAAHFMGRWFARVHSPATVLALWGLAS